jgi:hypothetical protein
MTDTLPDPRRYGGGPPAALVEFARAATERDLIAALRDLAAAGRDDEIHRSLAASPDRTLYARIFKALAAAIEKPASDEALGARVFAIPWVIVCGGSAAATIACVLPDVGALARVLEPG